MIINTHPQRTAWSELINRYPWHHYITLTFRYPASYESASLAFRKFIRRLERKGNGIWSCHVIETGRVGGLIHFHALLGGTDHLTVDEMKRAWRPGISDVRIYDPDLGARWYMTKALKEGRVEVEFSAHIDRTIRRWEKKQRKESSQSVPDRSDHEGEAVSEPTVGLRNHQPSHLDLPHTESPYQTPPVTHFLPPPASLQLLTPGSSTPQPSDAVESKGPEIGKAKKTRRSRIKKIVRWIRGGASMLWNTITHSFSRR